MLSSKVQGRLVRGMARSGALPVHVATSRRSRKALAVEASKLSKLNTGAWVVAPDYGAPKGVVHFLGGAFAGAAPQVLYSFLLDTIANAGYVVVATPYAVTFRHDTCANQVYQAFQDALAELQASGMVPPQLPTFGLGHSNGSLLHLLIGSFYPGTVASNMVISYNNKQVKDAVPIPGLMDSLPSTMQAARSMLPQVPLPLEGISLPSSNQVLSTLASLLPPGLDLDKGGRLSNAGLALDQLASVFGEVGSGTTDFYPTPEESRRIVASSYGIPRTLIVRFSDDNTDESPEMERILRARMPQGTSYLTLPGTHLTPCGGEVPWPSAPGGAPFTPADALAQALKESQQADVLRLSRQLVGWMDSLVVQYQYVGA